MAGQRGLISNQFDYQADQELTPEEAASACGPTAALAFARYTGRNPTIGEALSLAKQVGWTPSLGMAGPGSEVKLLGQLGVSSSYQEGATPDAVAQEVQAGRPVIVDTPNHYFAMDGYNPSTGQFHVGGSGLALRGGSEWMTWDQIAAHGGGARGAIFVDPSVKGTMQSGATDAAQGGQMAGTSTDITNGLHGPDEWQKIVDAHGGSYRMAPGQFKTDRWGTTTPDFSKPGTVVFADGTTALAKFYENNSVEVMPQPGVKTPSSANAPKQVGTNTRDRTITTIDAHGNVTSVDNPNYTATPTDVNSPSSQQWIVTRDANGVQHKELNPNYIAPTMVSGPGGVGTVPLDDAIKTAQLLQDKLAMQVEQGRLTNETAAQHFNQWWQVNVEYPLKLHEARVAEINAAQTASQNAQDIALRSLQYRVGPNFGADFARGNTTLSGGGGKISYSPDDFTFDMPNFNQIGQQAANAVTAQFHPADKALAAISPTAAANVGAPPPNLAAMPAMAAAVPYTPPVAAQPAAPVPAPYVGSGMRDRG